MPDTPAAARPRIAAVDMARGGGILAVVAAHMGLFGPVVGPWVYEFYMPLFFVLAGYLNGRQPARPLAACLPRLRRLGGSYLAACGAFFLLWLPVDALRPPDLPRIGRAVFSILYGRFYDPAGTLPLVNDLWAGQLWFLTALCTATVLFFAVRRLAGSWPRRAAALAVLLLAAQLLRGMPVLLPWCLDTAPLTAALMLAGAWLGEADWLGRPGPRRELLLLPALAAYVLLHDTYDLHTRYYGRFAGPAGTLCVFLAGLGGSMLFLRLCAALEPLPALRAPLALLGRRSLDVMVFHSLWLWVLSSVAGHLPEPAWGIWVSTPGRLAGLLAVLALCLLTGRFLRRFLKKC